MRTSLAATILFADDDERLELDGCYIADNGEHADDHLEMNLVGPASNGKGPIHMIELEGAGIDGTVRISLAVILKLVADVEANKATD